MLSVTNKLFMLNVIMVSVMAPSIIELVSLVTLNLVTPKVELRFKTQAWGY